MSCRPSTELGRTNSHSVFLFFQYPLSPRNMSKGGAPYFSTACGIFADIGSGFSVSACPGSATLGSARAEHDASEALARAGHLHASEAVLRLPLLLHLALKALFLAFSLIV